MGNISDYSNDSNLTGQEKLIGADVDGTTKNFPLDKIADFIVEKQVFTNVVIDTDYTHTDNNFTDEDVTSLSNKVDKVTGKSLVDDAEIERLAGVSNVDVSNKVDKVEGKSLILDTEITRLGTLENVDISGKENLLNKTTDINNVSVNSYPNTPTVKTYIDSRPTNFQGFVNHLSSAPTLAGEYDPTDSGTYTNFLDSTSTPLVIDLTAGKTTIIFDGTFCSKQVVPIDLSGYVSKEIGITNIPDPILTSYIGVGVPSSGSFVSLRLLLSQLPTQSVGLGQDTLKLAIDFLSHDSNINGIAVYFITSLGAIYSGTLPYSTTNESKHFEIDSSLITKDITGTPEIYIRVFFTDNTKVSPFYLSNIKVFSKDIVFTIDDFNYTNFSDNVLSKSFIMPSLSPMNKEITIENDLAVQSFIQNNKWYKKKLNCLGDSITEVNGTAEIKYYQHLLAWNNLSIVRQYGYSGRCIGKKNAGDTDCMSTMYTTMDDDADLITVWGGTNDWHLSEYEIGTLGDTTNNTFYGALDVLIKGLTTKYPTKTIAFFTPLQRTQTGSYPLRNLEDYANAVIAVCKKYSIPCLDLYHNGGFCPAIQGTTYSGDGLHPNNAGHLVIAKKMYYFLNSL